MQHPLQWQLICFFVFERYVFYNQTDMVSADKTFLHVKESIRKKFENTPLRETQEI